MEIHVDVYISSLRRKLKKGVDSVASKRMFLLGGELPTNRKWIITPVISGLTLLIPFITGVITHLRFVGSSPPSSFQTDFHPQTSPQWSHLNQHSWYICQHPVDGPAKSDKPPIWDGWNPIHTGINKPSINWWFGFRWPIHSMSSRRRRPAASCRYWNCLCPSTASLAEDVHTSPGRRWPRKKRKAWRWWMLSP